jgi:competence protein ComEC
MEIFCFFLGVLYAYTYSIDLLLALLCFFYLTPNYKQPLFFLLGCFIAGLHLWWVYPKNMPNKPVLSNAVLQGTISSIPTYTKHKTQFIFLVEQLNGQPVDALVQLSWYNKTTPLKVGEHWQLTTKIKKTRNFSNPGSYDYVTSLAKKHIYWSGYIRSGIREAPKATRSYSWLSVREYATQQLVQLAPNPRVAGIIAALTLNNTAYISSDDWELFRRTGTIHLFGISGEHIALLSGLFFFIARRLWSQSTYCCLMIPASSVASAAGLSFAVLYAFLAGFEPPVQRALIGCFFYMFSYLGVQRFTPWQVWRYALLMVLCIEPHAVFMQGFYFSFLAVVCLLLTHQRWRLQGIKGNLALQLSCLIGLMPLSLYWFSYGSINGFLANLFAIPLVGFLIVPLSLITLCISIFSWAWIIMIPLAGLINLLFTGLQWTEYLAVLNITWSLNSIELVLPLIGALLIGTLLPIKPFQHIAVLWLFLPFFPNKAPIQLGEARIHILDVGQGLAISVQTQKHVLLYDTGDQFFQGSDLGQMVILPFYQALGVKAIDALVISHPDKDHLGGMKSIEAALPVTQLIVNDPQYYRRGVNCHRYPNWEWDKVHFRFLPIQAPFKDKNNNSCILQISTAKHSILFTGDIEKQAEDYLVTTFGEQLQSEVLLLPHHGSKTSSSYRFLLEVSPKYAVASLGFDNRFRFPHAKTLNTLHTLNIPFYRTDDCGMVELTLSSTQPMQPPRCSNQSKRG